MIGSRQHIAESQAVEEDGRGFYALVLIAEKRSVLAICVSISRSATKLRNIRPKSSSDSTAKSAPVKKVPPDAGNQRTAR